MDEKEIQSTGKRPVDKRKYVITAVVFAVLSVLVMWNDDIFTKENVQEVIGSISNGFFITGGLFAGVGALSYIGSKGTYDTLSYGVSKIGIHHIIPGMPKDIPESFYDYKMAKDAKGRIWFSNLLWTGLAGVAVSALFAIIYSLM